MKIILSITIFLLFNFSPIVFASEFDKPSIKQCNKLFENQQEIDSKRFAYKLFDKIHDIYDNTTYSYVSKSGRVTRNGPFSKWRYEAILEQLKFYKPSKFSTIYFDDHSVTWEQYLQLEASICEAYFGAPIRSSLVNAEMFSGKAKEWSGHASNWESFPYIETGKQVINSPSPQDLEHYTKYTTAAGVIIVGGQKIPDEAFYAARDAIIYMTSEWPAIRDILRENKVRISLFGPEGDTSILPEYPHENEPGGFAMGLTDASMTANSAWLCYPGNWEIGGNPVIHEMAHTINHVVFETTNETYFYERVYDLALSAINRGVLGNFEQHLQEGEEQEIGHMIGEYWAIAVEGYIMNRGPKFKNSHYSHEWIKENDPKLYDLIRRYYPKQPWSYCPGVEQHM